MKLPIREFDAAPSRRAPFRTRRAVSARADDVARVRRDSIAGTTALCAGTAITICASSVFVPPGMPSVRVP
jgi:hypothetical protein